ncbi:ketopantoate reductase family protein [Oceanobacillus chungangensis]|uniref:2-dehydropantoate 2-reductase n=1 Tax=Oceanobacillus chungangensis TaxID=1229152 RepID=A0A3D8PJD2_9BACI|nr:ketopantoate reductase family protein [Oceanobacillus chungangensis]RDW16196.1 2-dehydropantoate 2-reductase [Oceanobacillus chungangensis]
MRRINSVSLIGLGAIGAAYGSKLQNLLGDSLTVVANKERIERYQSTGLKVNDDVFYFNYQLPKTSTAPADLVIFAVKNAELNQAIEEVKSHIGPNTIILSLLNGISSEEDIYEATKNEHILYSMCVGIDAVRNNTSTRYSSLGKICYGDKNQCLSSDVLALKDLFDDAHIAYEIADNIWHTIWAKFMFNVGINQTSAVLRAPYGIFQNTPLAYEWAESAMYEVVAISQKVGVQLTEEDMTLYRPILHNLSPNGKTSMLQDMEAGRKTEVEYFAGKVCALGRKFNVPTPVNDQLYKVIQIMEEITKYHK